MSQNRSPKASNASTPATPTAASTATGTDPAKSAAPSRPRGVSQPGAFVSAIDDLDVIDLSAPVAEEVTVYNCPNITRIIAPKARVILARRNLGLKTIDAPECEGTIDVRGSGPKGDGEGITINAPNVRKIIRGEFK